MLTVYSKCMDLYSPPGYVEFECNYDQKPLHILHQIPGILDVQGNIQFIVSSARLHFSTARHSCVFFLLSCGQENIAQRHVQCYSSNQLMDHEYYFMNNYGRVCIHMMVS